jgi:hypothetical protein
MSRDEKDRRRNSSLGAGEKMKLQIASFNALGNVVSVLQENKVSKEQRCRECEIQHLI